MKEYNTNLIIGLQWGDEGKGKIIDMLSEDADYVVNYQGGNNAGHSIYQNNSKTTLDMLPLGILNTKGKCILGSGIFLEIESFLDEVYFVEKNFRNIDNLYIDGRTHIIMPYHILLDKLKKNNTNKSLLKTKEGINSCYIDKINKVGIRVVDLLNMELFSNKLLNNLKEANEILSASGENSLDFEYIYTKYEDYAEKLKNIIIDSSYELNKAIDSGKKIVFEASKSTMIDSNFGTYPDVAPMSTVSAAVCSGTGIAPNKIKNIIGIFKSYSTRSYEGIFPTELVGQEANHLRDRGNEYISNTGYARRCGWLDLVILKYTCMLNGITELNMTKLDVLTGIDKIKLAVAYEIDGKVHQVYPINYATNKEINILYKEFETWTEDITNITDYNDLPENCKRYVEYIEGYLETKISLISVGPEKSQTIIRK